MAAMIQAGSHRSSTDSRRQHRPGVDLSRRWWCRSSAAAAAGSAGRSWCRWCGSSRPSPPPRSTSTPRPSSSSWPSAVVAALVAATVVPSAGLVARMIAPCIWSATAWVNSTVASANPTAARPSRYSLPGQGAGDAADVLTPLGPLVGGEVVFGDDVADADPPARGRGPGTSRRARPACRWTG